MAEEEPEAGGEEAPKKGKKGGLIVGLVLALVGGGGAFAVTSGMIPLGGGGGSHEPIGEETAFVPVEPMTVSVGDSDNRRFLRFRAELEVEPARKADVEKVMPRVVDVLNTYLQSLSISDFEDPSSLLTLRSQMRRRIELVVGGGVHDLLVMEFVVN